MIEELLEYKGELGEVVLLRLPHRSYQVTAYWKPDDRHKVLIETRDFEQARWVLIKAAEKLL